MTDIESARRALQSILNLPNVSKDVRYYATVAISHLPLSKEDNESRVQQGDKARDPRP
jgi:hypothetical protein